MNTDRKLTTSRHFSNWTRVRAVQLFDYIINISVMLLYFTVAVSCLTSLNPWSSAGCWLECGLCADSDWSNCKPLMRLVERRAHRKEFRRKGRSCLMLVLF